MNKEVHELILQFLPFFSKDQRSFIENSLKLKRLPVSILQEIRRVCHEEKYPCNLITLLQGCRLVFPKPKPRPPNPVLEARRQKLKALKERNEYNRMLGFSSSMAENWNAKEDMKAVRTALGIALNVIVATATGFAVPYILVQKFSSSKMHHLSAGLAGATFMMVVEMMLFITKMRKTDGQRRKSTTGSKSQQQAPYIIDATVKTNLSQ
eukprot:CAMPEP_0117755776 /NCGR_PEP_ID=MMETSP0947-20121206/13654_1 /TAXON_ID=44440 /ORGANISM="Chattonella subsalsa, Strain CCMP2191" /LENGTH=208 /DNA_ID=CAMNT_0005575177 /DNA_START=180 /DNA_END=806 /DNA_ORIENTATION=+